MRSYLLRALAEGVRVEQEAEDKMMESAVEAFENGGLPMASKQLLEVDRPTLMAFLQTFRFISFFFISLFIE